jgi:transcriptional regulator with XRE-family HTH domain
MTSRASTEIDIRVGRNLRRARQHRGYTQDELARRIGVRSQQVQKYESGENRITAGRLWQASHHLRVPITDLFDEVFTCL